MFNRMNHFSSGLYHWLPYEIIVVFVSERLSGMRYRRAVSPIRLQGYSHVGKFAVPPVLALALGKPNLPRVPH